MSSNLLRIGKGVRPWILASAGPTDKILKDSNGKLHSFPEILYQFYSSDAHMFMAGCLKEILDNPPRRFYALSLPLQEKARHLLVLELVSKFCENAEALAAFALAFATQFYMDGLSPEEVWKKLAQYQTVEIVNFYRSIKRKGPSYIANLAGYPPLDLQESQSKAVLLRSTKQLAGYLNLVAEYYMNLRELYNAYKHGFRVFPARHTDETTRQESVAFTYIDRNAQAIAVSLDDNRVRRLYDLCVGMSQLLHLMLEWHRFRLKINKRARLDAQLPVFGKSAYKDRTIRGLVFPTLMQIGDARKAKADEIAMQKSIEISKLPRGDVIAIDIDTEEILPYHSRDVSDVIRQAMDSHPGARLVFRRIAPDGKVGQY